jgi:hypothetical protein
VPTKATVLYLELPRYPLSMQPGLGYDDSDGGAPPKLSLGQRMLLVLPRMGRGRKLDKQPVGDWMRKTFMKPEDPDAKPAKKVPDTPESVEELEEAVKTADDKERAIGLVAAPLAAAIGFLVIHTLVANDPAQHLKSGALNPQYVNPSLYDDLFLVLLALSFVILIMAMLRKRLFLGIATALYGLAVFNLHYWGFGVPFVMAGAWYLVRAYRLQRDLKLANGEGPSARYGRKAQSGDTSYAAKPNKRYTPPSSPPNRAVRPKRAS